MSEFLDLLALYYLCDAAAAIRPLSGAEFATCSETYETIKSYFLAGWTLAPHGTAERAAQMREAYLAFQAWEAANAELVAMMRVEAMDVAGG